MRSISEDIGKYSWILKDSLQQKSRRVSTYGNRQTGNYITTYTYDNSGLIIYEADAFANVPLEKIIISEKERKDSQIKINPSFSVTESLPQELEIEQKLCLDSFSTMIFFTHEGETFIEEAGSSNCKMFYSNSKAIYISNGKEGQASFSFKEKVATRIIIFRNQNRNYILVNWGDQSLLNKNILK